jgi:glutathione-regulated potassium-efflux system ancillary protein KefF
MMLRQASNNPDVLIRSLYGLYPDFIIDVQAEQQALEQAELSSVDSAKSLAAC